MEIDLISFFGALSCGVVWGIFVYINLKIIQTRRRLEGIHKRMIEIEQSARERGEALR